MEEKKRAKGWRARSIVCVMDECVGEAPFGSKCVDNEKITQIVSRREGWTVLSRQCARYRALSVHVRNIHRAQRVVARAEL